MIYLKNVLETIDGIVVIPLATIAFFLLIYIVLYIYKKDADVVRSRIFLKYDEFKKAFLFLAVFAFILVLHISLIYVSYFYSLEDQPLIEYIQRFFGLILVMVLVTFVYKLFRSMRNGKK